MVLFFVIFSVCLFGCDGRTGFFGSREEPRTELVLGTLCRIDLYESGTAELYDSLFRRLAELDAIFSLTRSDSELVFLNGEAGLLPVPVSIEMYTVLERALFFAEASGGAFDPTIGPLVSLWGIGGDAPQIPPDEAIDAVLELVNWKDLELRPVLASAEGAVISRGPAAGKTAGGTALLRRRGMTLDLGAIAKGYAADELARMLRVPGAGGKSRASRAVIDLGGNIYVLGEKGVSRTARASTEGLWRIGLQNPLEERGSYAGIVEVPGNISVVTSGSYERFFTGIDGRRYHHILDTRTGPEKRGFPVENGLLSVTIIAGSSMDADALSTACFVLGYEKGRILAEANKVSALFIFTDKTIRGTTGVFGAFTVTGEEFHIVP